MPLEELGNAAESGLKFVSLIVFFLVILLPMTFVSFDYSDNVVKYSIIEMHERGELYEYSEIHWERHARAMGRV